MQDSLLEDSGLSRSYWGEAMLTANYLINRLWSSSINDTPYSVLYGRKPSLRHLGVFGSNAWMHIPKAIRKKSQPKTKKLRFTGYEPGSKSYYFNDARKRILISRFACFAEQNWNVIDVNFLNDSLSDDNSLSDVSVFREEKLKKNKKRSQKIMTQI
uniref:Retroviral polymerase SH3-like domain-containing protein n=1 Tax=Micrurus lemniscatus lemniscatus TaxID=129467 RepID=A0A2D4HTR1_MICLE